MARPGGVIGVTEPFARCHDRSGGAIDRGGGVAVGASGGSEGAGRWPRQQELYEACWACWPRLPEPVHRLPFAIEMEYVQRRPFLVLLPYVFAMKCYPTAYVSGPRSHCVERRPLTSVEVSDRCSGMPVFRSAADGGRGAERFVRSQAAR